MVIVWRKGTILSQISRGAWTSHSFLPLLSPHSDGSTSLLCLLSMVGASKALCVVPPCIQLNWSAVVLNGWCLSNWVRSATYYWCYCQDSTNVIFVALVRTGCIHNCTHIYSARAHKVRYLHYSGAHVMLVAIVPTATMGHWFDLSSDFHDNLMTCTCLICVWKLCNFSLCL